MKRKAVIIISLCCIIAAIVLAVLISRSRSRLSVFGNSTYEAPNVDFSVQFQSDARQLVCIIINNNDYEITYDGEYYLEREKGGKWYEITDIYGKRADERSWTALAYGVPAHGKDVFTISLDRFKPLSKGKYRVAKKTSIGPIFAYFQAE
jgi:hypothetical protein